MLVIQLKPRAQNQNVSLSLVLVRAVIEGNLRVKYHPVGGHIWF